MDERNEGGRPAPRAGRSGGRPVLVGTDGSEAALAAVRWAATEAARRGVALRVLHGFAWPNRPHLADPGLGVDPHEVLLEHARAWLREATEAAHGAGAVEVSADLRVAHPVQLLVHDSAGAGLVVVGSRGLGGLTGLLLGSVAVEVAARAACPVAVVRGAAAVDGPVVVGVDGSPLSEAALAHAYAAADAYRTSLVAVHTWDRHALDPLLERLPTELWERELLAQRLAGWGEKYPDVPVRRVASTDRPAKTLLRAAEGARLVVVGSRGHGGFAGLLLGSTSRAMLHHAPCPVLVVRPDAG